jgi:hypothetical protein
LQKKARFSRHPKPEVLAAPSPAVYAIRTKKRFQPNASLIKGVVCGVRVEEIEDETMRKARYLDKLIDELAKGKAMEKILRK